jgi:stage V sporulation protein B
MGIYYLIFPIYSLLISLSSSGIAVALSTEVAKCRKIRHRYNEQKLLRVSLVITFLISLMFTILIVIFAKRIANLQGNVNAYKGYIIISPAIIISSLIATLRGYFKSRGV